jgi:23S rRNA C2498 (ribose-2'-O)-methylase RlmM
MLNHRNMQTAQLIQEIFKLPMDKKFFVVEQTLKSIKSEERSGHLALAAETLYEDYSTDKELTAFTALDFENFYEAK